MAEKEILVLLDCLPHGGKWSLVLVHSGGKKMISDKTQLSVGLILLLRALRKLIDILSLEAC